MDELQKLFKEKDFNAINELSDEFYVPITASKIYYNYPYKINNQENKIIYTLIEYYPVNDHIINFISDRRLNKKHIQFILDNQKSDWMQLILEYPIINPNELNEIIISLIVNDKLNILKFMVDNGYVNDLNVQLYALKIGDIDLLTGTMVKYKTLADIERLDRLIYIISNYRDKVIDNIKFKKSALEHIIGLKMQLTNREINL